VKHSVTLINGVLKSDTLPLMGLIGGVAWHFNGKTLKIRQVPSEKTDKQKASNTSKVRASIAWPALEELILEVRNTSLTRVARRLGVNIATVSRRITNAKGTTQV
jgi:hypothetical protein